MKRRSKIVLWAILGVWVVAMLTLLLPMLVTGHREKSAVLQEFSEYAALLVDRHFEQAYQYCGSDFRKAMPYDEFIKLYNNLEDQNGRLKAITRQAYEVHGKGTPMYWSAVIDADFVYDKKTLRFEFVFHKEESRWVVFGFEQL